MTNARAAGKLGGLSRQQGGELKHVVISGG